MRIHTILGARPQFVKAAVVSRAFQDFDSVDERIIHTGQHYDPDMSDVFFDQLGIPTPWKRYEFGGGSHGKMTGNILIALEELMLDEKPDMVLIYGDTNSTLAGALAAAKLHIPVAHIEAGLRSFNKEMPEEVNRILSDHVSEFLFCPTHASVENLKNENITKGVHHVGDVMHDASIHARSHELIVPAALDASVLESDFALCTVHRAENTDNEAIFNEILAFIKKQSEQMPVIIPVHPRVRDRMKAAFDNEPHVHLIEPQDFFTVQGLLARAAIVLTDSGGLQKEAYFHRAPCFTMRSETEWVETIEAGWNRLWKAADAERPRKEIEEYGAGDAGQKIAEIIAKI